jgi:hypothetical protein
VSYDRELEAYRSAKAALRRWDDRGGYGPALEVTDAENQLALTAYALAEAVDATVGGGSR